MGTSRNHTFRQARDRSVAHVRMDALGPVMSHASGIGASSVAVALATFHRRELACAKLDVRRDGAEDVQFLCELHLGGVDARWLGHGDLARLDEATKAWQARTEKATNAYTLG